MSFVNEQNDSETNNTAERSDITGSEPAETNKTAALSGITASEPTDTITVITPNAVGSHSRDTSILELSVCLAELLTLGMLSSFIVSDLRVIRWYEKKRRS